MRPFLVASAVLLVASAAAAQPLVYSRLRPMAAPEPARHGQFGAAVAVLGDLDRDGRADYAAAVANGGRVLLVSGATGAVLRTLAPPAGADAAFSAGALAAAGDVDGDGRPDLAVVSGADARTRLVSGATGAVVWAAQGPAGTSAGFGVSAASIGDVNGDGRPDIAVGVPQAGPPGQAAGRVLVLSGATGAVLYALDPPRPEAGGEFGAAVAAVPDLDGDGRPDLAVGAPGEAAGGVERAGRVHVFSGARGALVRTLTSSDPRAQAEFGRSAVAVAGLVAGGGAGLVVGAPGEEVGSQYAAGRVYVLDAGSGAPVFSVASHLATGGGRFGAAVAGAGDVDGDGRPDLAVGEPGQGRAHVVSGATKRTVQVLTAEGFFASSSGFGAALAGGADLDGDGRPDLVVGAPSDDVYDGPDEYDAAGRTYVVSFLPAAQPERTVLVPGYGSPFGQFGVAVAAVPDVSGDGRPDLAVGAPGELSSVEGTGRVYVVDAARDVLLRAVTSPAGSPSRSFGASVSGVCDVNGDGAGDLVVGAPTEAVADEAANGAFGAGRAYVLSGADGSALHALVSPRPEGNGEFGRSVAAVGDVDGDGRCDLAVGAPGEFFYTGRTYVFSGATGALLLEIDSPLVDRNPGSVFVLFGSAVAGAGDVNGDGRPDLVVGAPRAQEEAESTPGEGRAWVFSGADGSVLHALRAPQPGDNAAFGNAVAGVGDVDGDGRPDVAVGSYGYGGRYGGSPLGSLGRAYVFSGASGAALHVLESLDSVEGERRDGRYGWSVAGAGDVDGDGRADVAVGAPGEGDEGPGGDGYSSGQGRVYVHSGADGSVLSVLQSPLADYTPGQSNVAGGFGAALAAADLDGDGRADLVVGAPSEGAGNVERAGRAYAFSALRPAPTSGAGGPAEAGAVGAPFPNPARSAVSVPVTLARPGAVHVVAYDVLGRTVGQAAAEGLPSGSHTVRLDVAGWAPGTYVVRVEVGSDSSEAYARRVVVVR